MMQTTAQQMQACGMLGMYWAHDVHLYDNTDSLSLQAYANIIAQYNGSNSTPTFTLTPSLSPTLILTPSPTPKPTFTPTPTPKKKQHP